MPGREQRVNNAPGRDTMGQAPVVLVAALRVVELGCIANRPDTCQAFDGTQYLVGITFEGDRSRTECLCQHLKPVARSEAPEVCERVWDGSGAAPAWPELPDLDVDLEQPELE